MTASDGDVDGSPSPLVLLDVNQAAAYLNVTPRFMSRLVFEHLIAVHRLGRHVRFSTSDLEAYAARGRSKASCRLSVRW